MIGTVLNSTPWLETCSVRKTRLDAQHRVQSRTLAVKSEKYYPLVKINLCATAASLLFISMFPSAAEAEAVLLTAQVFDTTCAGCHAGGGNIVKRDATLQLSDLVRYGIDSPDALYEIIYAGRGSMPGYGEECAPKGKCTFGPRLSDGQIHDISEYILEKAKLGWEK